MRSKRPRAVLLAICLAVSISAVWHAPAASATNRHVIGVRERGREQELFDRRTGKRFVPRGANLILLVPEQDYQVSSLFMPSTFDLRTIDRELGRMAKLGYNTVRVFIDLCRLDCISTRSGNIRAAYARNIARFLREAQRFGLVVVLASADLPDWGYGERLPCCDPFGGYRNSLELSAEGHDIGEEYWTGLVRVLKNQHAPLEVVLAYELEQEQFLMANDPPLSLASGLVTTADGHAYDMASDTDKAAMVDANVRL